MKDFNLSLYKSSLIHMTSVLKDYFFSRNKGETIIIIKGFGGTHPLFKRHVLFSTERVTGYPV